MKLCDKIHHCRKRIGLSQEALAERIGVSRQAISKWETGEASPEISKLPLLARTFGVTADWLLDDAAEPEGSTEQASSGAPASADPAREVEPPVHTYPGWVENLPGAIGRMIKRYGWIFGLRVAISGALFTAMGLVARAIFSSMINMGDSFHSSMFPASSNAGVTFYDNAGNVIDPGAWGLDAGQLFGSSGSSFGFEASAALPEPFAIFCNFIIVVGLVLLIGGALLAWYLRRWGRNA